MSRLKLLAFFFALSMPSLAQAGFRKGPYLMDARQTSMAVLFELDTSAPAVVRAFDVGGVEVARVDSPTSELHEVALSGLRAGTEYLYEVVANGQTTRGSFRTAATPDDAIAFVAYGDHRTDHEAHAAIARRVREENVPFVVDTGDMVGRGADLGEWQTFFEIEKDVLQTAALFPALGNHELVGGAEGLANYVRYMRVPEESSDNETYYAFTYGPVRFLMLDSNDEWARDGAQRLWLERELGESEPGVEHVFVVLHHGVYSSGLHGNHARMQDSGVPDLLRASGVSLVLSGHDHDYERGDADGLKYIVTGGGGAPLYDDNDELPSQLAFESVHHYVRIEVDGEDVRTKAVRRDGSIIETCRFRRSEPFVCEAGTHPTSSRRAPRPTFLDRYGPALGIGALALALVLLLWRLNRKKKP